MKKLIILLLFFMSIFIEAKNFLRADLDNDGRMEKVVWRRFAKSDLGDYYQLFVYDDNGALLWRGPRTKNEESPYFVASLDYGVSIPELLMDIDDDYRVELMIPAPQSDVSTTWYHRLKWVGRSFEPMPNAVLELHFGTHNDWVQWTTHPHQPYTYWASDLRKMPNGTIKAQITGYPIDNPTQPVTGVALIRPAPFGGAVYRWIQPIPRPDITEDEYAQIGDSQYSSAQNQSVHYQAKLSWRDHYNSRGVRLHRVRDILRQDRANFYKLGGDSEDEADRYFNTFRRRKLFNRVKIIPVGTNFRRLKNRIVNGTPLVDIRLKGNRLYIQILD